MRKKNRFVVFLHKKCVQKLITHWKIIEVNDIHTLRNKCFNLKMDIPVPPGLCSVHPDIQK